MKKLGKTPRPAPRFTVARISYRPKVYALFDNATHDHITGLHRKEAGRIARMLNRRIIRQTWQPKQLRVAA